MSQTTQKRSHIGRAVVTIIGVLALSISVSFVSLQPVKVSPNEPYSCTGGRELTIPMDNTSDHRAEVTASSTYDSSTGAVSNISLVTNQGDDGHTYTVAGGQLIVDNKPLGAFTARWALGLYSIDPSAVAPPPNAKVRVCLRP